MILPENDGGDCGMEWQRWESVRECLCVGEKKKENK